MHTCLHNHDALSTIIDIANFMQSLSAVSLLLLAYILEMIN